MSLTTKLHSTMHRILALKVDSVRSTVAGFGQLTWAYSQVQDPTRGLIVGFGEETSGGICEMLAARWLEQHANDGHIANILTPGGVVNETEVRRLMAFFAVGTTMNPQAMVGNAQHRNHNQSKATAVWLASKGVVPKQGPMGFGPRPKDGGYSYVDTVKNVSRRGSKRRVHAASLASDIGRGFGTYKMIGIRGSNFAHACAAWSHQDVAFFDPNWGEFWFESQDAFKGWFPRFWDAAGYGTPAIGLSESYEVIEYYRPGKT